MTSASSSFSSSSPSDAASRRRALLAALRSGASSPSVADLSTRFSNVTLSPVGGGGNSQAPVRLTSGESVFVVHAPIDMTSNTTLCGVSFGNQGKRCFRTGCAVQSHVESRRLPGFHVDEGIYVRTGPGKDVVYEDPVGELSLLANHQSEILTVDDCTPALWNTRFNTWRNSDGPAEAKLVFDTVKKAKAMQTPKKRADSADGNVQLKLLRDLSATEILENGDLPSHLEAYERVWVGSAKSLGEPLDSNFSLGDKLLADSLLTNSIMEATLAFKDEQKKDRTWTEQVVDETALRITDVEKILGDPSGDSATVWSAISTITSGVDSVSAAVENSVAKVAAMESELEQMLVGLQDFRTAVASRVTALESSQRTVPADLDGKIKSLEEDKENLQLRLDTLEARLDVDNAKILIGETVLRSPLDLRGYCLEAGLPDGINFGGFVDVYTLFLRIQSRRDSVSLDKMIKTMKDVKSLDLTVAEAVVVYSHSSLVPPIFGTVVEGHASTSLSKLPNYKAWRNRSEMTGLAYTIEKSLSQVHKEISSIISQTIQGSRASELKNLATTMVLNSQSFVTSLIRWVDETHEHLVDGGSPPEAVWLIITRVLKEIFEEYLAPARSTGTDAGFSDKSHEASVMIWGAAKTDIAACKMADKGIRNHPVVVGAYAQWMVGNSGLKEADAAKKEAAKACKAVTDFKVLLADQAKALSEAKSKIETVKKVADKAHQKAFSS